jgi:uncharacterized protein involved in response to NO
MPHRLFFFGGIVQGVVLIALLGLSYKGSLSLHVSPSFYHGYGMAFVVFTQFFVGFLLTTFPRYLARPSVEKRAYILPALGVNLGGGLLVLAGFIPQILGFSILLNLASFGALFLVLFKMWRESKVKNKSDTTWILGGFIFGILGQVLFLVSLFLHVENLALHVSFYLYLFLVVLVVSQKMIPFFASNQIQGYVIRKSKYFLHAIFVGLLLKVGLGSMDFSTLVADIWIFGVLGFELLHWKLPFRKSPPILWVLFLSIWWAPIGFLLFMLDGISKALELGWYFGHGPLHALALGYFTTVLIGFGTRVLMGHSGRKPTADRYTTMLFILIQFMTIFRVSADIVGGMGYLHLLIASAILWIITFAWWSGRFGKILFEK